jgi:hypothetical protein
MHQTLFMRFFAKKYHFYSSALVAGLYLGREAWKNVSKQIKAAVSQWDTMPKSLEGRRISSRFKG